jgi:hypothetical protein
MADGSVVGTWGVTYPFNCHVYSVQIELCNSEEMSEDSREDNVYMAKLAEQAERYDEVRCRSREFPQFLTKTHDLCCRWLMP